MKKLLAILVTLVMVFLIFLIYPLQMEVEAYDGLIPVSYGTSVTVYEKTTNIYVHNFSVPVLMGAGGNFSTNALEYYTVSSDGTFLKIHCFRDDRLDGLAVGNNIVAVRLNGVSDFPEGLWASIIVNYTLGHNGIEESRFNALGPDTQIGPYIPAPEYGFCTRMGDQHSELVLGFALPTFTLAIYSEPTGVTFTVDGAPYTTPWSGTYSDGTSVNLVMPETHNGYLWSHWSDSDTNRIKTVIMDTNITLTAIYEQAPPPPPPPTSVGGKAAPIAIPTNKPDLLAPYIALTILLAAAPKTVVYVKNRKKQ